MSKKLYLYTICLGVLYVVFVGHSLFEGGHLFIAGFKEGWNEAHTHPHTQALVCGGDLTPVNGSATFPSRFLNLKTGEEARLEIMHVVAYLSQAPEEMPSYVKMMDGVRLVVAFVLLALFIYLPFVVYRILKAVPGRDFYGIANINRIRKVSFILFGIFFAGLLSNLCMTALTNAYMQMEGYRASFKTFDYPLLFLGLVILVLSEILRYTRTIQAEQDLTI
jgi:hypothetical protein